MSISYKNEIINQNHTKVWTKECFSHKKLLLFENIWVFLSVFVWKRRVLWCIYFQVTWVLMHASQYKGLRYLLCFTIIIWTWNLSLIFLKFLCEKGFKKNHIHIKMKIICVIFDFSHFDKILSFFANFFFVWERDILF